MKQLKNKKLILLVTVFALFITNIAYASGGVENYQIIVDGKPVQFTQDLGYPTLVNGRTLVPIRVISENMGYKVEWENSQQKVTISDNQTKIEFKIGETNALVNGKKVPMDTKEDANGNIIAVDTKAQLIRNRTYVPLRFISENMGATVDWKIEGNTLYVYITRPGTIPTVPDVGTISGIADYSTNGYLENIKKVNQFFGEDLDKNIGGKDMVQFNPIGGGTDTGFLYVVDRPGEDFDALVVIKDWYRPQYHTGIPTEEAYQKLNPTAKEILRFYLPDEYERLYQIIDDGFNGKLGDSTKYTNKDISDLIGSDKKVEIIDAYGLQIKIGVGRNY